jgi:hypothetical protein
MMCISILFFNTLSQHKEAVENVVLNSLVVDTESERNFYLTDEHFPQFWTLNYSNDYVFKYDITF